MRLQAGVFLWVARWSHERRQLARSSSPQEEHERFWAEMNTAHEPAPLPPRPKKKAAPRKKLHDANGDFRSLSQWSPGGGDETWSPEDGDVYFTPEDGDAYVLEEEAPLPAAAAPRPPKPAAAPARRTLYDELDCPRDAPLDVLRAAYKRACFALHPDRGSSPDAARFGVVVNAWHVLRDADRRARYDAELARVS